MENHLGVFDMAMARCSHREREGFGMQRGDVGCVGDRAPVLRRRPRCRIGLWAFVTSTAFSLASAVHHVDSARWTSAWGPKQGVAGLGTAAVGRTGREQRSGRYFENPRRVDRETLLERVAQLRGGGSVSKNSKDEQRETLYEAYNMLHTLAQVRCRGVGRWGERVLEWWVGRDSAVDSTERARTGGEGAPTVVINIRIVSCHNLFVNMPCVSGH